MSNLLPKDELGDRLAKLRKEKGWLQKDLADRMEREGGSVTPGEVSRWEAGKHQPEYSTVAMWARALGVEVSEFMAGEMSNGRPTPQELSEVDAVWLAEVRRIAALDEPESWKMLYRDSLAALMGRAWGIAEARAQEARARAVERGEEAAARRAEVLSSDQQEDAASRRAARRAAAGPPDRTTSDGETTTGTSESDDSPPTA